MKRSFTAASAEQVSSLARQISLGSQSLAQNSSEQARSLEEVTGSLHAMSATIRQNAGHVIEARTLSDGACNCTKKGVESMTRLAEAVNRVLSSADQTSKILKTIDEIAFQTNLLALYAAVKAARAGDVGKGFRCSILKEF